MEAGGRGRALAADAVALAGFVAGCLAVSALGALATARSVGTWYQGLAKPAFTPPDAAFAPVWTALFVAMAVAAWRVWRRRDHPARRPALVRFGVQLGLNLLWSVLFFGLRSPGAALVEIVALLAAIAWTAVCFARVDRVAALLMIPYAAWVAFALALNAAIWWLNRG